jgi:hypothetical protein
VTIVCAIHEPGVGTWIGSDRQETRGWRRQFLRGGKWVVGAHWAVGVSGSAVLLDILAEEPAWLAADVTPRQFVKALRERVTADGWARAKDADDDGGPPRYDGRLILASAREVWEVDAAMHCRQADAVFIGGGEEYAEGAAHALCGMSGEKILKAALDAAIACHAGCGGDPFIQLLKA